MKAFVEVVPSHLSQGIHRVAGAMKAHAPNDVLFTPRMASADFAVFHVIGLGSLDGPVADWLASGKPYGVVQYCYRTTENPASPRWLDLWRGARVVWSYYDLPKLAVETGLLQPDDLLGFTFLHAPMGAEPSIFTPGPMPRKSYMVGTSGYIADTECVMECISAASSHDGRVFHLGPVLQQVLDAGYQNVSFMSGISDRQLVEQYNQCRWVAGMRRIEGFEMPALEGLMCGARPVMLDAPHYRHWFGEHADYITERAPADVESDLATLFGGKTRPVTPAERAHVADRFAWDRLMTDWWEMVRYAKA
jgi:hypothetical protein